MMFGNGSMGSAWLWLWVLGAATFVVLVAGILLLVLGRSAADPRGRGKVRLGVALTIVSLVTFLALAGMTISGRLPHPGQASVGPGSPGFVAGTLAAPRVVRISAGPDLRFYPEVVPVVAGETITFEVTTMGTTVHEFMVGPATDVASDTAGTPEVADIGMMQTRSVTYSFVGSGPFSFACHATGHYEAGMKGTITIQP